MAKPVYVLGGGGHGSVAIDCLLACGIAVEGVLDPILTPGLVLLGVPVRGDDRFLDQLSAAQVVLVNGVGAHPNVQPRRKLFLDLTARGFSFSSLCHPSVIVARECKLADGSQLMAGVVLQNRVSVGRNAVVNTRASIDHECVIADHAFIGPGAVLCGKVIVGESALVGAGAVILPGVEIGANAVIGAGAVVTKNIAAGSTVAGNPAAKI